MTSWLSILVFLGALVVGWRLPRVWVWLVVLLIPAYVVKLNIGFLPTNLAELVLWGGALGWLAKQPKANLILLWSRYRPLWWQLSLILVGLVVGVIVSGDLRLSLGIVKGWFLGPILFYGAATSILSSVTALELVPLLMLSTLPISIAALVQVVAGHFLTIDGRASAWFASANYLSLYLVPILLLGSITIFERWYKSAWFLFWVVTIPGLLAVYFSYSYGGWLALASGLVVIGLWRFRTRWQFWLISLGALAVAGFTQLSTERVAQMLDFKTQSSASVRFQVWATDWLMVKEYWLTGIGLGQYPTRYSEFANRLFHPPLEPGMLHAHNLYLQSIINLGALGLLGLIGLIVTFFGWVRRCSAVVAAPLIAAMTAILVHGLVDTPYWKNDLSMLFWTILVIATLRARPISDKINS
jgi:O-antigen ligase